MAMELSYVVVDTPMGPFTVGASESAVHEAFFGKPAPNVRLASHPKQPVLAVVHFSSPLFSFFLTISCNCVFRTE